MPIWQFAAVSSWTSDSHLITKVTIQNDQRQSWPLPRPQAGFPEVGRIKTAPMTLASPGANDSAES
jgi:hypothetical protein